MVLAGCADGLVESDLAWDHSTEIGGTIAADLAVLELNEPLVGGTEQTDVVALVQDDVLAVHADLELVALMDTKDPAKLGREHYASQLIYLADDPGRLHEQLP